MDNLNVWKDVDLELPPDYKLVLVYQHLVGRCLRYKYPLLGWYDEYDNLDDSELPILFWTEIPEFDDEIYYSTS